MAAGHATAAYATYSENIPLKEVLQTLGQAGFEKESICLMLSPAHPIAASVRESSVRPFERESSAVSAGLVSWLSEFGAVVIPTFGFFMRTQKFFNALLRDQGAVSECGHRKTLVSLGLPQEDAQRFEDQVRELGALLYISCCEMTMARWAADLMRATGAEETGLVENEAETVAAAASC